MPDLNLPNRQVSEYMKFGQSDLFFHMAVAKDSRISTLKSHFSRHNLHKVFLSANLGGFGCSIDGIDIEVLEKNYFLEDDIVRRKTKMDTLEGCVVIINNNDVGTPESRVAYAEFFETCTTTCFIGWDWDNHHWLEVSTFLAAHSDIYAPSHHENLYLLRRFNWLTCGPVYCTTIQWPRNFLAEHLHAMIEEQRSNDPLGMHIPYTQFSFRIQVISTLNLHFPSIGFSSHSFHARTPEDRLKEWYSHKTHWIMPVLNDVPIRIFDALVTGGIPIVPNSLRFLPPVNNIPRDHIAFYSPTDIVNPKALIDRSNNLFDESGHDGIKARHLFALQHHHGSNSVHQMLNYAAEALELKLRF